MVVPPIRILGGGRRFLFAPDGPSMTRVDHQIEKIPKGFFKLMTSSSLRMGKGTSTRSRRR
jgi:hypothetical protein